MMRKPWQSYLAGWAVIGMFAGPAQAQVAAPPAAPATAVPAPAPSPATPVVPAFILAPENSFSLYFNPTEREAIALAKKQFRERTTETESEADLLDQLQGIKSATPKKTEDLQEKFFAQFYLETLIYHTPTDWTVWMKDNETSKKFVPTTPQPPEAPLRILGINKEDVLFEWRPKAWQAIAATYKEGTPGVGLDKARQVVIFTLRVNQTLQSRDMQVKEGYFAPVATAENPDGKAVAPAAPAKPVAAQVPAMTPIANSADDKKGPPTVLELYKTLEPADKKP